ncbi:hypothetical protein [Luteimonas sp. A501]
MGEQSLVAHLRKEFRLDWDGVHGAAHWARVRFHGGSNGRGGGRHVGAGIEPVRAKGSARCAAVPSGSRAMRRHCGRMVGQ